MTGLDVDQKIKVNLFLIGAQKCGTTALFRLLAQHPQISASSVKEPTHFIDQEALTAVPQASQKHWFDPDAYHALFTPDADAKYYAEGTGWYGMPVFAEAVAHRIQAYNPDARFIYVMRDPVERIISHYHMLYNHGQVTAPIREAVKQSPWLMSGSDYVSVIETYCSHFSKKKLKPVISERFRSDPVAVFADVQDWLGLHRFTDPDLGSPQDNNVTPDTIGALRKVDIKSLNRWRRTKAWKAARNLAPAAAVRLGRRLLYSDVIDKDASDLDKFRQDLAPVLAEGVDRLRDLIDDPIPEWD
ncbi:MAG: sulfotransferase family protein [Alphaproteobacteria bacterium]